MGYLLKVVVLLVAAVAANGEYCKKKWVKAGCFQDNIYPSRPMPVSLYNMRDPGNTEALKLGPLLSWSEYPKSVERMLCECADLAEQKGYQFFGLQFFGECWSGAGVTYARDGTSNNCIDDKFKACDPESDRPCVGRASTNYVYKVEDIGKTEPTIDGGWTDWTDWSLCTKKCDGGSRLRTRTCTLPEPSGGGAECEGDDAEEEECNMEKCEKTPCTKKLDIGILMDASGSVGSANYIAMKDFIIELTSKYTVKPDHVHFGMLHYSRNAKLDFKINNPTYHNNKALAEKIQKIPYTTGSTRTDKALLLAEKTFFCEKCGRKGVPKVAIVFTDGKSNNGAASMTLTTQPMKAAGVTIIAVGIGAGANKPELIEIASKEDDVVMIDNFKYLTDKINKLLKLSCYDEQMQGDEPVSDASDEEMGRLRHYQHGDEPVSDASDEEMHRRRRQHGDEPVSDASDEKMRSFWFFSQARPVSDASDEESRFARAPRKYDENDVAEDVPVDGAPWRAAAPVAYDVPVDGGVHIGSVDDAIDAIDQIQAEEASVV